MIIFSFITLIFIFTSISLFIIVKKSKNIIDNEVNYDNTAVGWFLSSLVASILSSIFLFIGCFNMVNPGEVGVLVNLLGDKKGVEDKELTVGMHIISPWKTLYKFPIFEQNHQWTGENGFSFQTSEGLSVTADIGITFNLIPTRIHELFCKYRRGMDEITSLFIRNNVRDAINRVSSKMKIEELYGPKKEEFFVEVQKLVQAEVEPLGFHISQLYIIGRFQVPENVMEALNKKIESIQRAQQRENELRETEAEAKKKIAQTEGEAQSKVIRVTADAKSMLINAEAISESNRKISSTITPYIIQHEYINKWDGKMPYAIGGDKMPFMMSLPQN